MLRHFKKLDWVIIVSVFLLVLLGLSSIYSYSSSRNDFFNFKKQIIFFAVGLSLMFFLSFFEWRVLRENSYLILIFYFLSLVFLAGLFLFAPQVRGIRGWYKLGSFSFDPVEFAKIVLIILLAKYFSIRHVEVYRLRHILLSGLYALVPAALIFIQPNLGSSLILVFLWIGILAISGIKLRHFLILVFCGLLILVFSWFFLLKDYQKGRVVSFFAPQVDPLGISWNQSQAKIAIGSGGIFGQGFNKGSQLRYGFLPEPHTDFIFSAIAEEYGLVGILALFSLFLLLIWRIMKIALLAQSNFPRLFATGLAIVIFSQIFINIGMNLGILPVIGIALPFVSYGGSGLIAMCVGLGILQSIKTH
jgi:rod shape determining protein RodA